MTKSVLFFLLVTVLFSCTNTVKKKPKSDTTDASVRTTQQAAAQPATPVPLPPPQPDSIVTYPDTFYYKVPVSKILAFSAIMSGQMEQVSVVMWKDQVSSVNEQLQKQLKKIKNPNKK